MKILKKINEKQIPFEWLDLNYLPNSRCFRKEIYLENDLNSLEELAMMFYRLFGKFKNQLAISNGQWGAFCSDVWNPNSDNYDYKIDEKSIETKSYLQMLIDSDIGFEYNGICVCKNWDNFLSIILSCILTQVAPYSPLFYDIDNEFVFYFHHTGSVGFLYKRDTDTVLEILEKAIENNYSIKTPEN